MTAVKKSRVVSYTCEQMYNLVNDIEKYGEFLPYFSQGVVHYRDEDEVKATMVVTVSGMSKSFTTHNLLQTNKMIEIRLLDGPFSHLEGFWRFNEVSEGCQVLFDLEFDFVGPFVSMLLGPAFEQVANKMVDAFCDRAEALYGAG